MADGHYSKVFHVLADEFPDVFDDDRSLGCYVRLLMAADAAWPLRPYVPAHVNRRTLAGLVSAGLVVCERDRYSVMGLNAERSKRSAAASAGGRARAQQMHSDRSANAQPPLSLVKQSKAKQKDKRGVTAIDGARANAAVDPGEGTA